MGMREPVIGLRPFVVLPECMYSSTQVCGAVNLYLCALSILSL